MFALTDPADDAPAPLVAGDVCRGVSRLFARHDIAVIAEVPLDGGRRADLMGIDARGQLVIVEIKVSRADLLGDGKWTDYLAHCDRFYWAVPHGFDPRPLDGEAFLPDRCGVVIADRYDAAIAREAKTVPLSAPGRKRCTLAFARRAARRLMVASDPELWAMVQG